MTYYRADLAYTFDQGYGFHAADCAPGILALRVAAPGAEDIRILALPDDPVAEADALVGIGHALSYLPDAAAVRRGLGYRRPDGHHGNVLVDTSALPALPRGRGERTTAPTHDTSSSRAANCQYAAARHPVPTTANDVTVPGSPCNPSRRRCRRCPGPGR